MPAFEETTTLNAHAVATSEGSKYARMVVEGKVTYARTVLVGGVWIWAVDGTTNGVPEITGTQLPIGYVINGLKVE